MSKKKNNFYAYKIVETDEKGILKTWDECQKKVKGVNAKYKGFKTQAEAEAWLSLGAEYGMDKKVHKFTKKLIKGIYFDAGTGRGNGVEVRLTDVDGNSLLNQILNKDKVNQYDNYDLGYDVTNNYGELTGLYLALSLALKTDEKNIFGDSSLVINFWSKNRYSDILPINTIKLIKKVVKLRDEFEKVGGVVKFVSGDINPADLGFHK